MINPELDPQRTHKEDYTVKEAAGKNVPTSVEQKAYIKALDAYLNNDLYPRMKTDRELMRDKRYWHDRYEQLWRKDIATSKPTP